MNKKKNKKAFTLVEVLICVGIIGIIAAITIPALLTSTSEKALAAQRKALYSRMAQAFTQIKNLKAYEYSSTTGTGASAVTTDNGSALQFLTSGFSKVYKLANICDFDTLNECDVPTTIYDYYDNSNFYKFEVNTSNPYLTDLNSGISEDDLGKLKTKFAAFTTANGESILLYYNPRCKTKSEAEHSIVRSLCVNMIYDLNGGKQSPNAYGEDIGFISVFYPTDPTVAMPLVYHNELFAASSYANMLSAATEKNMLPPNIEELASILINKNLLYISKNSDDSKYFWSASYPTEGTNEVWTASVAHGIKTQETTGASAGNNQFFLLQK